MTYTTEFYDINNKLNDILDKLNYLQNEISDIKYKLDTQSDQIQYIDDELSNVKNDTNNILSNIR